MSAQQYYSQFEDEAIRKFYPTETPEKLLELLPGRTWRGIQVRASKLGVKRTPDAKYNGFPFEGSAIGHLSESEKGYLAGIIDGEGTIMFCRRKNGKKGYYVYAVQVSIANSSPSLKEWLCSKFPDRCYVQKKSTSHLGTREMYTWSLSGSRQVIQFLKEIAPYLVIKKQMAQILSNGYVHLSEDDRKLLYDRLCAMRKIC
jgi:hypothetical protein